MQFKKIIIIHLAKKSILFSVTLIVSIGWLCLYMNLLSIYFDVETIN